MINILLVDDDALYRTNFIGLMDWERLGCRIVWQADNGQQAIEIINKNQVNLVITDMDMPIINGIELIEYTRENCPEIQCLALSGFDDFMYVKESMRLGTFDYMLKHMLTKENLENIIISIAEKISQHHNSQKDKPTIDKGVTEAIVCDLLTRRMGLAENTGINEALNELGITISSMPFAVIAVRIEDLEMIRIRYETQSKYEHFLQAAKQIIQNIADSYGEQHCFLDKNGLYYVILGNSGFSSTIYAIHALSACCEQIIKSFNKFLNINAIVSQSGLNMSLSKLVDACQIAVAKIDERLKGDVLFEEQSECPTIVTIDIKTENMLVDKMFNNDFSELELIINSEFCKYKHLKTRQIFLHLTIEFLNILNRICRTKNINPENIYVGNHSPYQVIVNIYSYSEMVSFITRLYKKAYEFIHSVRGEYSLLIENALNHIKNNYASDISLASTADAISCNPAYLSRTFKNEVGCGFVEFLTEYRIGKAMKLLQTERNVKNVARKIGFQSYNYFFRVFKKHTGQTPQEYCIISNQENYKA